MSEGTIDENQSASPESQFIDLMLKISQGGNFSEEEVTNAVDLCLSEEAKQGIQRTLEKYRGIGPTDMTQGKLNKYVFVLGQVFAKDTGASRDFGKLMREFQSRQNQTIDK